MCGIAGILCLDGEDLPNDASLCVKSMTDSMSHRGPDGEGLWQKGQISLGHRRLSIIDLAGGAQPMQSADGRFCIVFNGEIYNFRSLRNQLENEGFSFLTSCDTEVILASYAKWGIDCLDRLEGMFAFALWDEERKLLFCARDRFGEKPFFYSLQKGFFCFSSELSAIVLLKGKCGFCDFSFGLDPHALARYLAYEYAPCPQTMYSEISSLPPAHYLLVHDGNVRMAPYWELPAPAACPKESEEALCENLYELMAKAVKMRMVSDVPLGVFLSGGIDSTIVAGLMAQQSTRPIETFSIGFTEASYDESRYARIAARAYGTIHHERILSAEECADELPGIVSRMDQPMADASCAPTWLLSGLARENVTVALGGDGADELWAGYEHYIGIKIAGWYNSLPSFIRKGLIEPLCRHLPTSAGYINPRLAVKTFLAGANSPDWLCVQTLLTAFGTKDLKRLLSPDFMHDRLENGNFLQEQNIFRPTLAQYEQWQPKTAMSPLARAFHVYVRQFMLDDILVKIDRCSMLHSLEVRAPFLDRHVAEFAAALPVNFKLHGFKRKYLLKKAFAGLLPPQILHRNKRGFQIPVAGWLRGRLKPLMEDMLSEGKLKMQGIFNPAFVRNLMDEHISGEADHRKQLWTLLVLELWLEASGSSY